MKHPCHKSPSIRICLTLLIALVLISSAGFSQWTALNGPAKPRNVKDLAVSSDGSTMYVADDASLYKSTDGGGNWSAVGFPSGTPTRIALKYGDASYLYAGSVGGVYYSSNSGNNWTALQQVYGTINRISTSSQNTNTVFLGKDLYSGYSALYRSTDAGFTWSPAGDFQNTYQTSVKDVATYPNSNHADHVWVVGSDGTSEGSSTTTAASTRGVWYSDNNGGAWTPKNMGSYNLTAVGIKDQGAGNHEMVFVGTASGKLFYSTNAGIDWSERTAYASTAGASSVRAIRVRPDGAALYVVSDAGVHKSTDNGGTWTSISGSLRYNDVQSAAIPSSIQSSIVVGTSRTLYKSTDAGSNWSVIENGIGKMNAGAVAGTGPYAWAVSPDYSAVAKYDSAAGTWTNLEIDPYNSPVTLAGINRHPGGDLFIVGSQISKAVLFRSTNSGSSFTAISITDAAGQLTGNTFNGIAVDPKDNTQVFAFGRGSNAGGTTYNLYRSITSGAGSYSYLARVGPAGGNASAITAMAIDPTGAGGQSQIMYAAVESNGIYKTMNAGSTWSRVDGSLMGTERSIALHPDVTNVLYVAGADGLWKTSNGGSTWYHLRTDDLRSVVVGTGFGATASYLTIVTSANHVIFSYDGGTSWLDVTSGTTGTLNSIALRNTSGTPGLYISGSSGVSSMLAPTAVPSSPSNGTAYMNSEVSWASSARASNYHLWVDLNSGFSSPKVNKIDVTGTAFRNFNLPPSGTCYWKVNAMNPAGETGYLSTQSFSIATTGSFTMTGSSSSGHPRPTWTTNGQNPSSGIVYSVYRYSCTYGAGDCGSGSLPGAMIATTTSNSYTDNSVTIASKFETPTLTWYYYVTGSSVSGKLTYNEAIGGGSKASVGGDQPVVTRLNQAYPNPFNPAATITYSLAKDGYVSLKVYDLLGREVADLVHADETAGEKSIQFDGSRFGSGIYYCRLTTGSYTSSIRMLLVK